MAIRSPIMGRRPRRGDAPPVNETKRRAVADTDENLVLMVQSGLTFADEIHPIVWQFLKKSDNNLSATVYANEMSNSKDRFPLTHGLNYTPPFVIERSLGSVRFGRTIDRTNAIR
jgi:hypothetical protein